MKNELRDYMLAVEENVKASKDEYVAKETKRAAYHKLMRAKDALRAKEYEMLEDCFRPVI